VIFDWVIFLLKRENQLQRVTPNNFQPLNTQIEIVAKNLRVPWSLAFLPDGRLIFSEREGRIKILLKGDDKPKLVGEISDVKASGEGGLLGLAVDLNFQETKSIYLYYTYANLSNLTLNRVVRYKFDGLSLSEPVVIVDKIPGAVNHNGGRLKFGPDGFLYITTGDAQKPSLAQDKDSLAGKILRVDRNGNAVFDNPFGNLIYSYGHRNPQGLVWDEDNRLWSTEHGPTAQDELNLIEKGGNYGWPEVEGNEKKENMINAIIQSGNQTWAPGGAAYFKGSIFFAGLRGKALFEYRIRDGKLLKHLGGEFGRIRDVILGPDNMLYIATSNYDGRGTPKPDDDMIIKVNPNLF
ncbi:MAG: PQQ-dependent sugar dehydrogenase, partial [Nitrososphaerota archaeon]